MTNVLMLQRSIWNNPEYRALPSTGAKLLYLRMAGDPDIDKIGRLIVPRNVWAETDDVTPDDMMTSLEVLQERSFVIYDPRTDEALVRSYYRNDNVWNHPKVSVAAAQVVTTRRLRSETCAFVLATELLRLPFAELSNDKKPSPGGRVPEASRRTICWSNANAIFRHITGGDLPPADDMTGDLSSFGDQVWKILGEALSESVTDTLSARDFRQLAEPTRPYVKAVLDQRSNHRVVRLKSAAGG